MSIDQIVKELQDERNRIGAAIKALTAVSGSSPRPSGGRRTLSASARRKISLAQKARWAKRVSPGAGATIPKRTLSASGRRKIAAAQRARWAKIRKENDKICHVSPLFPYSKSASLHVVNEYEHSCSALSNSIWVSRIVGAAHRGHTPSTSIS